MKVGVTVSYGGLTAARPYVARTLAELGAATIATYYPLVDGYRMGPPRAPLHDIPQMIRLANGRPLVLQEAGYSSARKLNGSPSAQATFVRSVFWAARRSPGAIPFLSFYTCSTRHQPSADPMRTRSPSSAPWASAPVMAGPSQRGGLSATASEPSAKAELSQKHSGPMRERA